MGLVMKRFFIILLCFWGCRDNFNEVYEENIVVYSFLCPNCDYQEIFVDKTFTFDEVADTIGISGASCRLWRQNGDTVSFHEVNPPGRYISPVGTWNLKPLTTYSMEVRYGDYVVKASTTVPDTFSILSPQDEDTIYLSSPPSSFIWSKSSACAIYNIWLFAEGDTNLPFLLATFDTVLPLPPAFTEYFDSTGWYIIKVVAKDTNYYERGNRESLVDSLDGGLGFVGSVSFDSARVYIKH